MKTNIYNTFDDPKVAKILYTIIGKKLKVQEMRQDGFVYVMAKL